MAEIVEGRVIGSAAAVALRKRCIAWPRKVRGNTVSARQGRWDLKLRSEFLDLGSSCGNKVDF